MELPGFAKKFASFISQFWFRSRDHPKEKLCFLSFLSAATDYVSEVLLRNSLVRLAIIATNTCAATHQLIDQPVIGRITRNLL